MLSAYLLNDWGRVEGRTEVGGRDEDCTAGTLLIFCVRFRWTFWPGCFTLNWMSGQSGNSPVDQILSNVDLAGMQDERARECIRLLLNLIESLTADLRKAQAEILYLREQLNRRKGGR
jgi:hypothetical protein